MPPRNVAGSGNVAAACNYEQLKHYAAKASDLENKHDYVDAAFAYSAAVTSTGTCTPAPSLLPTLYFLIESVARNEYNAATLQHTFGAVDHWLHSARESLSKAAQFRKTISRFPIDPRNRAAITTTEAAAANTAKLVASFQASTDSARQRVARSSPTYAPPTYRKRATPTDSCDKDSITTVSDDGAFIATLSGGRYIIDSVDRIDTMLWLESDDVVVCNDGYFVKLIHEDEIAHGHLAR